MHLTFLEVNEETVPFATAGIADATLIKQGYMYVRIFLETWQCNNWDSKTLSFQQFNEAVKKLRQL